MKKILVCIMMVALILGLAACGDDNSKNTGSVDLSGTEDSGQTTFSSDDWESYEVMVEGQFLTSPCSINQLCMR